MRAGGGKQKGASFERDVCRALSLWVSQGRHSDLFWRSAMSGGRATVHLRKGETMRQAGDISPVHADGQPLTDLFYIECKHVKDFNLRGFLFGETFGPHSLSTYWNTACLEARKYGKWPMVIAKQNLYPTLVVVKHQMPEVIDRRVPFVLGPYNRFRIYLFDAVLRVNPNLGGPTYADPGHSRSKLAKKATKILSPS